MRNAARATKPIPPTTITTTATIHPTDIPADEAETAISVHLYGPRIGDLDGRDYDASRDYVRPVGGLTRPEGTRREGYSLHLVEGLFSELRFEAILRTSC